MKQFLATLAYLRKSAWLLIPVAAIPSICLGLFTTPLKSLMLAAEMQIGTPASVWDIFVLLIDFDAYRYVFPVVLIVLSTLVFISLGYSIIERHMRLGKLLFTRPMLGVNYTISPVLIVMLTLYLVTMFVRFLLASVSALFNFLFSGVAASPVVVSIIIGATAVILVTLAILLMISVLLWVPTMLISGYSFLDSATTSLRLIGKQYGHNLVAVLLPVAAIMVFQYLLWSFAPAFVIVFARIACYLVMLVYYQALSMVTYFSATETQRRDTKAYYN